jgi:mono/diheme cytochrome c family protein
MIGVAMAGANPATAQTPGSILEGVYTEEQAARGSDLYRANCARCHGPGMQGDGLGMVPAIGGGEFYNRWGKETLGSTLRFVNTFMPFDQAGTLDPQTYADALAYVLKFSGYPAGNNELIPDVATYLATRVEPRP